MPEARSPIKPLSVHGDESSVATFAAPEAVALTRVALASPRVPGRSADEYVSAETAQRSSTPPSSTASVVTLWKEGDAVREGVGVEVSVSDAEGVAEGVSVGVGEGVEERDTLGVGDAVRVSDDAADADAEPELVDEREVTGEAEFVAEDVTDATALTERVAGAVAEAGAAIVDAGDAEALAAAAALVTPVRDAVAVPLGTLDELTLAEFDRDEDAELLGAAEDVGRGEPEEVHVAPLLRDTDDEPLGVLVDEADGVATLVAVFMRDRVEHALTVFVTDSVARADTLASAVSDAVALLLLLPLNDPDGDGERDADAERELRSDTVVRSDTDAEDEAVRDSRAEAEYDADAVLDVDLVRKGVTEPVKEGLDVTLLEGDRRKDGEAVEEPPLALAETYDDGTAVADGAKLGDASALPLDDLAALEDRDARALNDTLVDGVTLRLVDTLELVEVLREG